MQQLRWNYTLAVVALAITFLFAAPSVASAQASFIAPLNDVDVVSSTVPTNGDVNPYGIALVPVTVGQLVQGDILVSNFNSSANLQGTGTTIVQISPSGTMQQFAQIDPANLPGQCPGGVGLTTALVALKTGWVIVGSLPSKDGTAATAKAGCLLVLDPQGNVVETFAGRGINGPWDMTALDAGGGVELFVTNVLNGTVAAGGKVVHKGTVLRLALNTSPQMMPRIVQGTIIGSGFPERTDPAALIIGPTGLALSADNTMLYVANSLANSITAIPNPIFRMSTAGTGKTLSRGGSFNDPLGLTLAPNGNVIAANGADGNLVEVSPAGMQVAHKLVDTSGNPPGAGALFGLIALPKAVYFVDDATNTLNKLEK
jgi:hypothetical protein